MWTLAAHGLQAHGVSEHEFELLEGLVCQMDPSHIVISQVLNARTMKTCCEKCYLVLASRTRR